MSTTTIRLPADLKKRLSIIAEREGTSAHALILDAIAERVEKDERRDDFRGTAESRYAALAASGETVSWEDMKSYLQARVAGRPATRPRSRKIVR